MLAFDGHTKRQVATGMLEYSQIYFNWDFSTNPPTPTDQGWVKVARSTLPANTVIIRDPWQYKFTFTKEVQDAPYAN